MSTIVERRRRTRPHHSSEAWFEKLAETPSHMRREMIYARAGDELERKRPERRGLYAMALTDVDGDRDRAKARYILRRVDQIVGEFAEWEEEEELRQQREAERHRSVGMAVLLAVLVSFLVIAGAVT